MKKLNGSLKHQSMTSVAPFPTGWRSIIADPHYKFSRHEFTKDELPTDMDPLLFHRCLAFLKSLSAPRITCANDPSLPGSESGTMCPICGLIARDTWTKSRSGRMRRQIRIETLREHMGMRHYLMRRVPCPAKGITKCASKGYAKGHRLLRHLADNIECHDQVSQHLEADLSVAQAIHWALGSPDTPVLDPGSKTPSVMRELFTQRVNSMRKTDSSLTCSTAVTMPAKFLRQSLDISAAMTPNSLLLPESHFVSSTPTSCSTPISQFNDSASLMNLYAQNQNHFISTPTYASTPIESTFYMNSGHLDLDPKQFHNHVLFPFQQHQSPQLNTPMSMTQDLTFSTNLNTPVSMTQDLSYSTNSLDLTTFTSVPMDLQSFMTPPGPPQLQPRMIVEDHLSPFTGDPSTMSLSLPDMTMLDINNALMTPLSRTSFSAPNAPPTMYVNPHQLDSESLNPIVISNKMMQSFPLLTSGWDLNASTNIMPDTNTQMPFMNLSNETMPTWANHAFPPQAADHPIQLNASL